MELQTRHEMARRYGYKLRTSLQGDFLSQGTGDDLMKIDPDNNIIVYAHDANAYFVASLVRNTPR